MRQTFCIIVGVVLTITLTGCGDSPPDAGPVPFKAPTSPAIDGLKETMSGNAKSGTYSKRTVEVDTKAKAATGKEADKKP